MEAFPCPSELTVASALLLLSTTPPSFSLCSGKCKSDDCLDNLMLRNTKSISSSSMSVSTDESSSSNVRENRLHMIAGVARSHEMNLKVVRKSRTKTLWVSDGMNISSYKPATTTSGCASEITEASSCLSTGSSQVSIARRCIDSPSNSRNVSTKISLVIDLNRKPAGSSSMRRRAEAILRVLSDGGSASEPTIRQWLGDSPDTSKALRMLLKLNEVKRSGTGGRTDPYIYMIA